MNKDSQDDMESVKKEFLSDFNEAKLQIMRLSNAWERCGTAARGGQLQKWNWELDYIWRELSADATNDAVMENITKYPTKIREANILIAKYSKHKDLLYKILAAKEIVLKKLQDEAGKGSRDISTDEDSMDE